MIISRLREVFYTKRNKAIIYSFSTSLIARVMGFAYVVFITPLIVSYFSKEGFGLWSILILVSTFGNFADLGLGHSLMNSLSEAIYKKNDNVIKLISTTFFTLVLSSVLFSIILVVANSFSDINFNIVDQNLKNQKEIAINFLIVLFFANIPLSVIQKIQYAYLDNHIYHFWEFIQKVITIIGIYVCVKLELKFFYFIICFYCPFIFCNMLNIFFYLNKKKWLFTNFKVFFQKFEFKYLRSLSKSGILFFTMALLFVIGRTSDSYILARFSSLGTVTSFEIIKKPFDLILVFIMMLSAGMWPAYGDAMHSRDFNWIKKVIKKSLFYVTTLGVLSSIFFVLYGNQILSFWLNKNYNFSKVFFLIVGVWYLLLSLNNVISNFLGASNVLKQQVFIYLIYCLIGVPLKIYMATNYQLKDFVLINCLVFLLVILLPTFYISYKQLKSYS